MDLEHEGNPDTTVDALRWIHTHKTAVLLKASITAGAVIGGAKPDDVARLGEAAEKIGLAFQIRDDVLDETQTSEVLGKTAGKDAVSTPSPRNTPTGCNPISVSTQAKLSRTFSCTFHLPHTPLPKRSYVPTVLPPALPLQVHSLSRCQEGKSPISF